MLNGLGGAVAHTHTQRYREEGDWTPGLAANSAAYSLCAFAPGSLRSLGLRFPICSTGLPLASMTPSNPEKLQFWELSQHGP